MLNSEAVDAEAMYTRLLPSRKLDSIYAQLKPIWNISTLTAVSASVRRVFSKRNWSYAPSTRTKQMQDANSKKLTAEGKRQKNKQKANGKNKKAKPKQEAEARSINRKNKQPQPATGKIRKEDQKQTQRRNAKSKR